MIYFLRNQRLDTHRDGECPLGGEWKIDWNPMKEKIMKKLMFAAAAIAAGVAVADITSANVVG